MFEPQPLLVFDVQRFCVHDGPGIRTVVFLKGCPLRCRWCQNPESLRATPEVSFHADRCIGCHSCVEVCPNQAAAPGPRRIDRDLCQACGACCDACPAEALRLVGRHMTAAELFEVVVRDQEYYRASGGGVTLSGGEPMLQAERAVPFLERCREAGIHTAVETAGAAPWRAFEAVLPLVDLFYFDLKVHPEERHSELVGGPLEPILDNARSLVAAGANLVIRMPVVPALNDHEESVHGIAEVVARLGRQTIRLLPYHRAGEDKIDRIASAQQRLGITRVAADDALSRVAGLLRKRGLEVVVEGVNGSRPGAQAAPFPQRVWRLREAVQAHQPELCAERALLVTEYFRQRRHRAKPMVIQKAEALRHLLSERSATIYPDEILVGNFSSRRVGGSIYPELHGVAMLEDLWSFDRRPVNPLRVAPEDRRTLLRTVLPFWLTRFLAVRAFRLPRAIRFVLDQLRARRYLINESGGISHLVPDYATLLELGTSGLAARAATAAAATQDPGKRDFYRAVEIVCEGLEAMATRHATLAREQASSEADPQRRAELEGIAEVCERVPRHPARTLHEAFQSLFFAHIAINLESLDNAVCPGRLDQVLYPYYAADTSAGRLDDDGARELVGCFTVKMSEIVPVFSRRVTRFHGGLFNGQTVVVGGVDRTGKDATNQLTWIFLDAMDQLRMRQPNYHARIHRDSPRPYLDRIAEILGDGSAAPSLMNDEVVVPMLAGRGFAIEDARDYSPVGCIEPVACGATFGSTDAALVNLALCLERALGTRRGGARTGPLTTCRSLDELVPRLAAQVDHLVSCLIRDLQAIERANAGYHPTPLTSMLLRGCMDSGKDCASGGATYNASGVQGVGIADLADSLAAIDHVVFKGRQCSMATLVQALEADFEGFQGLRGHLLKAPKFGNDDRTVDRLADLVMAMFSDALARHRNSRGGPYVAGFYSVTAHVAFGETTAALPSGRRAGKPLANGLSAGNGCDRFGPTAALGSVASLDLVGLARNGINVNLTLDRPTLAGADGSAALAGLIEGYFGQGGMQVQMNVTDAETLEAARDDPDSCPWLLVRVSGYSAYFNDLSAGMKQELIERTRHGCQG